MKLFTLFTVLSFGILQACNQNSKSGLNQAADSSVTKVVKYH